MLVGLIISYLVYLGHAITTSITIRGKDDEIKKEKEEVLELTKRIHQLELENEKIRNGSDITPPTDQNAL